LPATFLRYPFGCAQGKLLFRVLMPFDEPFLAANLFFRIC
jgi:hypothetical protein